MADLKTDTPGLHFEKRDHKFSKLVIISGPSGVGKTTLYRSVLERFSDMLYSVSYTTRMRRDGEKDGVDYHFISKEEFKEKIEKGKWAEWAKVHDHYYGTSAEFLYKGLASGQDILLDIDVQGTIQILKQFPDSITIFIMPPSLEVLKRRLESRGSDSKAIVEKRLLNAVKEVEKKDIYRHVVVNDQLSVAMDELISIVENERLAK